MRCRTATRAYVALSVVLAGLACKRPAPASALRADAVPGAAARPTGPFEAVDEVGAYYRAKNDASGPWADCLRPGAYPTQSPIDLAAFDAPADQRATVRIGYRSQQMQGTFAPAHVGFQVQDLAGQLGFSSNGSPEQTLPLVQFHFHKPAEHRLPDGSRADMELHFVHKDATLNPPRLIVLGVMLKKASTPDAPQAPPATASGGEGAFVAFPDSSNSDAAPPATANGDTGASGSNAAGDNATFANILRALVAAGVTGATAATPPGSVQVTMADLLPPAPLNAWVYQGGLTTTNPKPPDCGGDVTFVIASTPVTISGAQLDSYPYSGTFRDPQPVNDKLARQFRSATEAP